MSKPKVTAVIEGAVDDDLQPQRTKEITLTSHWTRNDCCWIEIDNIKLLISAKEIEAAIRAVT